MLNSLLICTDLDRTLIPNGIQHESANARRLFSYLSSLNFVTLVYVTGRDIDLVNKAIKSYHLPVADYVIADVGSTIYALQQGNWHYWDKWQEEISPDWDGKSHDDMSTLPMSVAVYTSIAVGIVNRLYGSFFLIGRTIINRTGILKPIMK